MDIVSKVMEICKSREESLPYKIHGSNPNVVILGESHWDHIEHLQQILVAKEINPCYVLHEVLRNNIFDPHQKRLFENPDHPTPIEILEPALKQDEENERRFGNLPYDWSRKPRGNRLTEWLKDVDVFLNPIAARDFSMLFDYDNGGIERFKKDHPTIEKYIGCDISLLEMEALKAQKCGFDEEQRIRENRMGSVILEYAPRSASPLLVVVGAGHIESTSEIFPILENANTSYLVVDLSFDECKKHHFLPVQL